MNDKKINYLYEQLSPVWARPNIFSINSSSEYVPLLSILQNFKIKSTTSKSTFYGLKGDKIEKLKKLSDTNFIQWQMTRDYIPTVSSKYDKKAHQTAIRKHISDTFNNFTLDILCPYHSSRNVKRTAIGHMVNTRIFYSRSFITGGYFLMDKINKEVCFSAVVHRKDIEEIINCFMYGKEFPVDKIELWIRQSVLSGGMSNNYLLETIKPLTETYEVRFVSNFKSIFGKNMPKDMTIREQRAFFKDISDKYLSKVSGRVTLNSKLEAIPI